jgi:hypothetical protein
MVFRQTARTLRSVPSAEALVRAVGCTHDRYGDIFLRRHSAKGEQRSYPSASALSGTPDEMSVSLPLCPLTAAANLFNRRAGMVLGTPVSGLEARFKFHGLEVEMPAPAAGAWQARWRRPSVAVAPLLPDFASK